MTTTAVGKPACAWDDPAARNELVTGLVNDALAILDRARRRRPRRRPGRSWSALLALVAGQDVEPDPIGPRARGGSPGGSPRTG